MKLLSGKKILIVGILNRLSIAYGIAKCLHREGADLAFTYQNIKNKNKIKKISQKFNSKLMFFCDVSKNYEIKKLFCKLKKKWNKFDGFLHAIAYSPIKQLNGDYLDVLTKSGFTIAHQVSSYSFSKMAQECLSMLNQESSLVTLTYIGSKKIIPNYNIMGIAKASLEANVKYMSISLGKYKIRVNAISPGPIRTVSSFGIRNFKKILRKYEKNSPLKTVTNMQDIGNVAVFLFSYLSKGITGEIIYVDKGFHNL